VLQCLFVLIDYCIDNVLYVQDVRSFVVTVDEGTTYAVFVCAMSRYGRGRYASLRFSTPHLERPVVTPPSMHSLIL